MASSVTSASVACLVLSLTACAGLAQDVKPAPQPGSTTPAPLKPTEQKLEPVQADQPSAGPQADLSKAALKFETTTHDFGKIGDETPVTKPFKFKNVSDRTITITNVGTSCGCTTAPLAKKTYAPGEEGSIDITFNPRGRRGKEIKHIGVTTDDPALNNVPIQLTIQIDIRARVMIEPVTVHLGEVRKGKEGRQNFTIIGREPNFEVTEVTARDQNFKIERLDKQVVEQDGDQLTRISYQVRLPDSVNISMIRSVLDIKTTDTQRASIQVPLSADVVGDLRVMPDRLPMMFRGSAEPWFREIRLDHRQPDGKFEITGLEVDAPADMQVALDYERETNPAAANRPPFFRVRVSGVAPSKPGPFQGRIIIKTNAKDQEEIIIPLSGNLAVPSNQ